MSTAAYYSRFSLGINKSPPMQFLCDVFAVRASNGWKSDRNSEATEMNQAQTENLETLPLPTPDLPQPTCEGLQSGLGT
jgi:hypothetical protein